MNELSSIEGTNISIIHINIRSMNKNMDEFMLKMDLIKYKFDVIIVSETWLESNDMFDLEGFSAFHSIRHHKKGGGVSAFVKSYLTADAIPELTVVNDQFESIGVRIKLSQDIFIIGTYRPPSSSIDEFNSEYFEMVNKVNCKDLCVLIGDFNIDTLEKTHNSHVSNFLDCLKSDF